jgi:hypothetical protein
VYSSNAHMRCCAQRWRGGRQRRSHRASRALSSRSAAPARKLAGLGLKRSGCSTIGTTEGGLLIEIADAFSRSAGASRLTSALVIEPVYLHGPASLPASEHAAPTELMAGVLSGPPSAAKAQRGQGSFAQALQQRQHSCLLQLAGLRLALTHWVRLARPAVPGRKRGPRQELKIPRTEREAKGAVWGVELSRKSLL